MSARRRCTNGSATRCARDPAGGGDAPGRRRGLRSSEAVLAPPCVHLVRPRGRRVIRLTLRRRARKHGVASARLLRRSAVVTSAPCPHEAGMARVCSHRRCRAVAAGGGPPSGEVELDIAGANLGDGLEGFVRAASQPARVCRRRTRAQCSGHHVRCCRRCDVIRDKRNLPRCSANAPSLRHAGVVRRVTPRTIEGSQAAATQPARAVTADRGSHRSPTMSEPSLVVSTRQGACSCLSTAMVRGASRARPFSATTSPCRWPIARDGSWTRCSTWGFRQQAATFDRPGPHLERMRGAGLCRGRRGQHGRWQATTGATLKLIWSREAGGASEPGATVGRHGPRRAVPIRRHGASWQMCVRCGSTRRGATGWLAATIPWYPFDLIDPRDPRCLRVAVSTPGRLAQRRCRRVRGGRSRRHVRPSTCPTISDAIPTSRTVIASCNAGRCPTRCGCSITTACSAASPGWRLAGSGQRPAVGSVSRWRCIRRDPQLAWFVPAIKDERRYPVDGQLVGLPARAMVARVSTCCATACRSTMPTISSTATAWPSTRSGDRLAFDPRPAACGPATTRAIRWLALNARLPPIHAVAFADSDAPGVVRPACRPPGNREA